MAEENLTDLASFLAVARERSFTRAAAKRGGRYAWEFKRGERDMRVRVDGQLIFNSIGMMLNAAVAGFGLAYFAETQVRPYLARGQLVQVMAEFCPTFSGHHFYYPTRGQPSPALAILIDALRYRS